MFDTTCVDPDNWMVEKLESVCEEVAEEKPVEESVPTEEKTKEASEE